MQFIDLKSQYSRIEENINLSIERVLNHGCYIMGPEVGELEKKLSEFTGCKHAITCSNGTDALMLALMAKGIKPGDAVIVPSFTFAATAEAVAYLGGIPVFADSAEDTFNLSSESLQSTIANARKRNLNVVGIITVDLFGQPANYEEINEIAQANQLWIIADCAQSLGATYKGKQVCSCNYSEIATTSFFPAKPLGCYGDGGALFTNNDQLAALIKSYRVHGQGNHKYNNERIGLNARLDTIQAAILIEKLKIFPEEIVARNNIAEKYDNELSALVKTPKVSEDCTSVWAQYTIVLPDNINRSDLINSLKNKNIPSVVYYPTPLHLQSAYKPYHQQLNSPSLKISEKLSSSCLSLPMSPYLSEEQVIEISNAVKNACLAM